MTDLTNQYTPRMMDTVMRQMPQPTYFLQQMTGINGRIRRTNKKYVELDKVIGNQVTARVVARNGAANVVGKAGFTNNINVAPYYKEREVFTPSDVDVREPGMTVYDSTGNQVDAAVARNLVELYQRLDRAEEYQMAQGLQTGKLTVSGEGVDYEIDFGMNANHLITLTGADRWTETTADVLDQIATWGSLITSKGAPGAAWLIGDTTSMDNLLAKTGIQTLLDSRRTERGAVNFQLLRDQRATYIGYLVTHGVAVDLYSYQGQYTDGTTGTSYNYMNANTVIMGSGQADVRKYYTKIENFKASNFQADRFPHFWEEDDGSAKYLQVESGPLCAIAQPDAFVTVVTTS